jgi:sugar O-acyltransferase (sialic acid O-acetyltransferase NeuD family)
VKKIVIIGSGGFAKEVAFLIDEINRAKPEWELLGFIDKKVGEMNGKYKIIGDDLWLEKVSEKIYATIGVGNPSLVKNLYNKFLRNKNIIFPNLIHPKAIGDWGQIILGIGNIITAGNIFTTDIRIGSFNVFNLSCTIGHDTIIGSYNVINPTVNISGGVEIEEGCLIGTGTQILQYKKICQNVTVGAGSLVTKNIVEEGVYIGVPAIKLKDRS